jgi:hypothetical protein
MTTNVRPYRPVASENDPTQQAVDAAVAAAVAASPLVLTPDRAAVFEFPDPQDVREIPHPAKPDEARVPERVRVARERRAAFHAAMARLRERGHADTEPINRALLNADADELVTAIANHALGQFNDAEMGRPHTFLHGLSEWVEGELVASIYAAPEQVLAALPDDGTPEVAYIRRHALDATTPDEHVVDIHGRPTRPRQPTLSFMQTLVPR